MEKLRTNPLMEADDGVTSAAGTTASTQVPTAAAVDKPTFTDEQQAYIDGLIANRYKKFQETTDKKVKAIEEAQKLAGMSEAEKQATQLTSLEAKLKEYEQRDLISQYKIELSNKGITADIADALPVTDADAAKKAVDTLANWKTQIETTYASKIKELEEKLRNAELRGTVPTAVKDGSATKPVLKTIY